jgi:hypothetical protein
MAVTAFAKHKLTRQRGYSWRMGEPRRGTYSFRITWGPGILTVSGDLGELTIHGLNTLWEGPWDAARFLVGCDYDYLMGKTGQTREFDRDETVKHLIRLAEEDRCYGGNIWSKICKHYSHTWCADWRELDGANVTHQMIAAKALRQDTGLRADQTWPMVGDGDANVYSYNPRTRWQYEAVMLWAKTVQASEPLTSKLARARRQFRDFRRSFKHYPVIFQPERWTTGTAFNGALYWTFHEGEHGSFYRSLSPLKLFGRDLSRFGLWRHAGSSWTNRDGRLTFRRVEGKPPPAGSVAHA